MMQDVKSTDGHTGPGAVSRVEKVIGYAIRSRSELSKKN